MNPKPGSSKSAKPGSESSAPPKNLVPPLLREVGKLAAGVACVSTDSEGSATGTLRNKYALPPGHSLMDWIRLGSSGKDLTGVGPQAGHLPVTVTELSPHNSEQDAWICIRGKVYNVTAYLPFHPGGPDQLMRGVGTDATALFQEVHPWVNAEQILNKCYIGPLQRHVDRDSTPSDATKSAAINAADRDAVENAITKEPSVPQFKWIQKLDYITVYFSMAKFCNPMWEAYQVDERTIQIYLIYEINCFQYEIVFTKSIHWPGQVKINCEIGKFEMVFKKCEGSIWDIFGYVKQKATYTESLGDIRVQCRVCNKVKVNYNTFLIEMERTDGYKSTVPIGKHVNVFGTIKGEAVVRSYTPVPSSLFHKFRNQQYTTDNICLVVKRYPNGKLSKILGDCVPGDTLTISRPLGSFNLSDIEKRETFIILAAGTGITPMFSIILFLLERRIRKCQRLRLLFFNRTSRDILFKEQFEEIQTEDPRFKFVNILSQPDQSSSGLKGHVSRSILEQAISEHLEDTKHERKDIYFMVCGPAIFTTLTQQLFKDLAFTKEQFHLFLG